MFRWLRSILEDKESPGKLSSARFMGLAWGLTSCAVALILVWRYESAEHALVAELIAGALIALGLRKAWIGKDKGN